MTFKTESEAETFCDVYNAVLSGDAPASTAAKIAAPPPQPVPAPAPVPAAAQDLTVPNTIASPGGLFGAAPLPNMFASPGGTAVGAFSLAETADGGGGDSFGAAPLPNMFASPGGTAVAAFSVAETADGDGGGGGLFGNTLPSLPSGGLFGNTLPPSFAVEESPATTGNTSAGDGGDAAGEWQEKAIIAEKDAAEEKEKTKILTKTLKKEISSLEAELEDVKDRHNLIEQQKVGELDKANTLNAKLKAESIETAARLKAQEELIESLKKMAGEGTSAGGGSTPGGDVVLASSLMPSGPFAGTCHHCDTDPHARSQHACIYANTVFVVVVSVCATVFARVCPVEMVRCLSLQLC